MQRQLARLAETGCRKERLIQCMREREESSIIIDNASMAKEKHIAMGSIKKLFIGLQ